MLHRDPMVNHQDKDKRRSYSSEVKAALIKAHLVDKVPILDLCDKHKVQPQLDLMRSLMMFF